LACHDLLAIRHGHTIRVCMRVVVLLLLEIMTKTLALRYWAIFVLQEYRLEANDLFPELSHLSGQGIIFTSEDLNFSLQVCEPLLFTLSTLQCGNTNYDSSAKEDSR